VPGDSKIVAIGPPEEVMAFQGIGVEAVPAESGADLAAALPGLALDPRVCLILVSESVAEGAQGLMAELRRRSRAIILLIPSHRGARGLALQWMRRSMEQSIGVDMIGER